MPNLINWQQASATFTELFPGTADSASDLKNKLTDDAALTAAIENSNGNIWIEFLLRCRFGVSPTNGYWNLYIIRGHDIGSGVAYEDGAGGTTPTIPARAPDAVIAVRADTGQQLIHVPGILAPPEDFKILLENKSGQTTTNTDNENELWSRFYSEEVQ